ncbi:Tetraspanin-7 [Halotydeus destructor]|nr:Tetraspanin-7 [Halotydeus destructor]
MQGVTQMRFKTKACIAGLKTVLMMFNVVFWTTGIMLVSLGLWMKFSLGKYLVVDTDYANFNLPGLFALIGLLIIIVGFAACSCTANGQTGLLYWYSGFLFVTFIVIFSGAIGGYVYRSELDDTFRTGLTQAINSYGSSGSLLTKDIDRLQGYLGCCGIANYTDYFATSWANGTLVVPGSCCIESANCPPRTEFTEELLIDEKLYQKGCYVTAVDSLSDKFQFVGSVALIISLIQLFGAFNAGLLAKYINKAVYETLN